MKVNNSEELLSYVSYNPDTGIFLWVKSPRGGRSVGDMAGHSWRKSHVIRFRYVSYSSHRVAWRIMTGEWPTFEVDHRDVNPCNNKWDNLRPATRTQNSWNMRVRCDSICGLKGAGWVKDKKKWKAKIKIFGKQKHLGYYSTAEEAHAAYCAAAIELRGEYARVA